MPKCDFNKVALQLFAEIVGSKLIKSFAEYKVSRAINCQKKVSGN